jgi:glucose-6-phosphate 1-dehydrogenase
VEGAFRVTPSHLPVVLRSAQIFTPILHWIDGQSGPRPRPVSYPYGSRGPKELEAFIGKYGYKRAQEG